MPASAFMISKSTFHAKIMPICQVAKSGRRARLAADQSSFEDSRYARKSSTSASVGEVCDHVIIDNCVLTISPHNKCHEYAFWFCLIHESQDDDKVGSMKKVVTLHGFCC